MYKFISRALAMLLMSGLTSKVAAAQNATSSQGDPKARHYVNKMVAIYKNMKSYSGAAKVSGQVTGQSKLPAIQATVSLQKPHFAAIRFTDGSNTNFAVFDGTNLYATASGHKNQYLKQPISKGLGIMRVLTRTGMSGPGLTLLSNQPDTLESFAPPSSLSLGQSTNVAGVPVVTVISETKQGQDKLTLTYHIGKNDYLLRQMTLVQTMGEQTVTMTETHTNIKINTKFPASSFTFTPPRGAKQVKAFTASTSAPPIPPAKSPTVKTMTNSIGMKLAFIPRGTFRMGRPTAPNAQPIHNVTLIAFWIGQYEVTNREFALYKKRKLPAESLTPQQPAVSISWHDADQFCKWLSKRESRSYRLPTEAEWEYAARGGLDQKEYPWGDQRPEGRATFMSMTTTPVGKYAPNGYGLYDVAGNAGEWVSDWYGESYYSRSPAINPKGSSKSEWDTKPAPKGQWKILRGGSHMLFEGQAGVREPWPLDISPAPSGFRVVMEKKKTH